MNLDHTVAVGFEDMLQQLQIGFDEMRPALDDDAEHLQSLPPDLLIAVARIADCQSTIPILIWCHSRVFLETAWLLYYRSYGKHLKDIIEVAEERLQARWADYL